MPLTCRGIGLAIAALLASSDDPRLSAQDDTGSKPRRALMKATIAAFAPATSTASLRPNNVQRAGSYTSTIEKIVLPK